MDFDKFLVHTPRHYRIAQRVTREIDEQVLALALSALPQSVRDYMYNNVSRSAERILREDVAGFETDASQEQKQAAVETVYAMYEKMAEDTQEFDPDPKFASETVPYPEDVVIRTETKNEIVDSIVTIAKVARTQGLLALEGIHANDRFFQLGLQLVVDGADSEVVHAILERTKTTLLHELDEKLSMMIEGLESTQAGDNPMLIEARLKAYLTG